MRPTRLTLVATVALVAALLGFGSVFVGSSWLAVPLLLTAVLVGVGIAARYLDLRVGWVLALQLLAALLTLTSAYVGSQALFGIVPTPSSLGALTQLAQAGFEEARAKSIPVISTPGLVLVLSLALTPVAIATDNLAASIRPVLAGLPLFFLYTSLTTILRNPLPPLSYAVPVAGFLALLWVDESDRKRRWGRSATDTNGFGGSVALLVGLAAVVLGLLVPSLIPTPNGGVFQLSTNSGPGGERSPSVTASRLTDLGGQLNLDNEVDLFTVRTAQTRPQYLRTTVLEQWNDQGWSSDKPGAFYPVPDIPRPESTVPTTRVSARVTVQEFDDNYVPVYGTPQRVTLGNTFYFDPNKDVVFSPSTRIKGRSYTVTSAIKTPTAQQLQSAAVTTPAPKKDLQRPNGVAGAVVQLTADVVGGAVSPYDKAMAINDFFTNPNNGWSYSLTVPKGDTGNPLRDFLVNRTGFCEQYASAMASMLRLANVPARVVIGYTPGTKQDDGSWQITTNDAHAWVEALIGDAGWITFDPTPIGSRATPLPYAPTYTQRQSASATAAASAAAPTIAPRGPRLDQTTVNDSGTVAETGWSAWTWAVIGIVVLVVVLLLAVPFVVRTRRRRARLRAAARDDGVLAAHSAWAELVDTATDHARPVDPATTPRGVVAAWQHDLHLTDAELDSALQVLLAEEQARYAPAYSSTATLAPAVKTMTAAIARHSDRGARIRARLLPATWRSARPDDEARDPHTS